MPRPGFYNDNLGRSYPFVDGETLLLPDYAVCDFGCMVYAGSGFVVGTHSIFLNAIRRTGDTFEFEFTSDAPGLAGRYLRFTRSTSDARYATDYAEPDMTVSSSSSLSSSYCPDAPYWLGFLVTGDMQRLSSLLSSGEALLGPIPVEPSLIRNTDSAYITSLNVGNMDRTRAENSDDCRPLCWPFVVADAYVVKECITGIVRLQEGYNTQITLDTNDNVITIAARVGAGMGEPYSLVRVTEDEDPPTGRTLLDGALDCCDLVRSINGVGCSYFCISAGNGITITPYPDQHKIVIDADMKNLVNCLPRVSDSSLPAVAYSEDPCACGPA